MNDNSLKLMEIAETKDSEQEEKLENKIKDDEHKDPKD